MPATIITPSDSYVYAFFDYGSQVCLDTIMALTISTDVDVKPVWNLGSRSADGYTFGPSLVAGTIVFPKTMSMPFDKLLSMNKKTAYASKLSAIDFSEYSDEDVEIKPEYSVPFSLLIISSTEYKSISNLEPVVNFKYIEGVKIVQTEEQMDQNAGMSMIIYKYTARNISDKTGYVVNQGGKIKVSIPKRNIETSSSKYTRSLYQKILSGGS